jgi:hypothetical protein
VLNRAEIEHSIEQNEQYGNCQRREYSQERSIEDEHETLSFVWFALHRERAVPSGCAQVGASAAERLSPELDFSPRSP